MVVVKEKKTDWLTPVAITLGVAGLGAGLLMYFKKAEGIEKLKITSYKNLDTGATATPPDILELSKGDFIRVTFQYQYKGPAIDGIYHLAIWKKTGLDPHDEFASTDRVFNIPDTPSTKTFESSIDLEASSWDMSAGKYGLYVKIGGIPAKDIHLYLANVLNITTGNGGDLFSLAKPSADPYSAPPGQVIITCPVSSMSLDEIRATVKCIVYEGSFYPGHGAKLWESSKTITFSPEETIGVEFIRTSVYGTIDRRDIEVQVFVSGALVESGEWDDVYYVTEAAAPSFELSKPWAYPQSAPPGQVLITCPVRSTSTEEFTVTIRCIVYEGSIYPGHGDELWRSSKIVTFNPGESKDVEFLRNSIAGSIDRRDVGVEVLYQGQVIESKEEDDVYYVTKSYVDFRMEIDSIAAGQAFPGANRWMVFYYDPVLGDFVGDSTFHFLSTRVNFDNVAPGGYLAVFLYDTTTGNLSDQFTSPSWDIIDSHTYEYNPVLNRVIDIT